MSDDRRQLRTCWGPALHEYLCRVLHDANTGGITPDEDDPTRYAEMADATLRAISEVLNARADWMAEGGPYADWVVSRTKGVRMAAEQVGEAVRPR